MNQWRPVNCWLSENGVFAGSTIYEYEWQGEKCTGIQQSLFLAHGLPPKKQVGDALAVSVCSIFPKMTCPWRPWFELIVVLLWAAFLLASALVGFLEFS